ncbi:MAG: sugar transferase [Anaerolineales bacterium]|jgi:lipopolysaccharide/colanic/teichoic acid biosynthesis glycosyltransferase
MELLSKSKITEDAVNATKQGFWFRSIKRMIDIILAILGIAVTLPFLPFLALAIVIESPGPIIYTQQRVGLNGEIFRMHKFRSMQTNAEAHGPQWAAPEDERITRVGRMMRCLHLDEFPQLINILRGEMSVVGPRPELPEIVDELAREMPMFKKRHSVKPGATGWAFIQQGYADSKEAAQIKLNYDLYYITNQSICFDFKIILRTLVSMIQLRGR